MIVWSGKGFLAVLILIISFGLFVNVFPKEQGDYAFVLAFFIAGAFSWFMGKKWNEESGRTVIDKVSGQEIILKENHSLFWIKLQYWGIIFSAFGLIILIQTLV
jgi:hypothetical protein